MDKVKAFLSQIKRQHFWILSVVTVGLGFLGWAMTVGKLQANTTKKLNQIEKHFKDVAGVQAPMPNPEKWNIKVQQEAARLAADVLAAWTMVYERQSTEVLKWPEIPFNRDGMTFPEYMQSIKSGDEMDQEARTNYSTYVIELFPKLLEIVDAAPAGRSRDSDRRGAKSGASVSSRPEPSSTSADDRDYKVNWQSQSQEETRRLLELPALPSTAQVRRVQEDLWVSEAILRVIAAVNESATGSHNAKIKSIEQLTFGKPAAAQFAAGLAPDQIEKLPAAEGGDATAVATPTPPATVSTTSEAGPPSEDDGRYVNETGAPLASASENPAEFKRIPVYLELVIDQREIGSLLAECAESPLPIEVRQFSMLQPGKQNPGSRSVTSAKPIGTTTVSGERIDLSERFRRDGGLGPYDVRVQIAGIIYIFNPPNKTSLSVTEDAATEAAN